MFIYVGWLKKFVKPVSLGFEKVQTFFVTVLFRLKNNGQFLFHERLPLVLSGMKSYDLYTEAWNNKQGMRGM